MGQQQQLLKQELTVSQILRRYGKEFRQVRKRYSDGPEDIDAKMYAPFSCVDCGQEFEHVKS